ncbi:hypothetical protein CRUP_033046 [Coryphaenoides rupestris]|nr:hypothetical protein CRUP_033046 [Coryphaenoides rupestris]
MAPKKRWQMAEGVGEKVPEDGGQAVGGPTGSRVRPEVNGGSCMDTSRLSPDHVGSPQVSLGDGNLSEDCSNHSDSSEKRQHRPCKRLLDAHEEHETIISPKKKSKKNAEAPKMTSDSDGSPATPWLTSTPPPHLHHTPTGTVTSTSASTPPQPAKAPGALLGQRLTQGGDSSTPQQPFFSSSSSEIAKGTELPPYPCKRMP